MKCLVGRIFVLGLMCVTVAGGVLAQEAKLSIGDLNWFGGCWEMTVASKGLQITEQWMKPAGD